MYVPERNLLSQAVVEITITAFVAGLIVAAIAGTLAWWIFYV